MIYLNNNTEQQTVYIPKNDGTGSSHKPTYELEGVDVTISQDITVVNPSSGYYGMSAVTIDASEYGQSNYDEGFDDGYTDGYSSGTSDGEQSIIDTFTSTTITINGQYGSSANPYSSVTVNVAQTGHTDQELQDAYNSGYTSGSTDGYNSGYTSGETHQKSLLVSTAITQNGTYTRENGYSAITVNVPQTGSTNSIISVTGNTWYVLDHYFGTGEQIEITNATFDYSVANGGRHQQLIAGGDGEWVRIGGNGDNLYTSYYGNRKIDVGPTILDDDHILLTNGAFYINDMETPVSTFSPYPLDIFKDTRMVVFANTAIGQDSVCGQTASVGVITIYDENDNVVDKYIPELHNGVICLHNVITGNYITPSGTGTPTITNTDYIEGYMDGRQDVIDTFTAMTAITNGVYGSSAQPLSSITVNVPQTGGTSEKLYVTVNGIKQDVQYYSESVTNWTVVNENYTTSETLEVFYVHYYHYKFHIYLLSSGKYGYWDEDENNPQPMNITTINGSATTQDSLSTYTMTEDGAGLIVTSNNPSYYDILVSYEKEPSIPLSSITITANTAITETDFAYSSITVNVPQSGGSGTTVITPVDYIHTTILSQSDNHIDTGIIPTTATTFRVQGMYKGVAQGGTVVGYSYNDSKDYRLFWAGNGGSPDVYYDFNNQRLGAYRNILYDGTLIDATCDNYSLTLNGNVLGTGTTQTTISDPHSIMIDVCSWWVKSLEIWDGSTKVFDGIAAYDENGNIGLYDSVSKQLFYNSELTMDYETSGSNLGTGSFSTNGTYSALSYNYDGFSSVTINVPTLPLSSITITANTVITETQFAYSAITVNVPQSGCSGVKYVEYIETDGTYIGFDFSTAHTYSSLDETICLDFMPLNGTVYSDTYYGFMGADNLLLWTIPYGYRVNDKYGLCIGDFNMYYGWSSGPTFSAGTRFDCAFSSTGANINNVDYPFTVTSVGTPGYIRLNWNGDISNPRCPVARYYGFKLMSGDTVICNYRPAIDNNGIPCFYEETTGEYYYKNPICSGTPIAGPVLPSPDYQSGYTDGYASGYTDGSASIASLIDRSITEAVIPSGVTKIGDQAFAACQNLKSITIPNSVTSINNNAFYGCYSLSSITIPSGVTLLGGGCFYNNYALSSITIPNSVTYLGNNVFYSCQALTSVTFSNSLTKIPSSCCYGCKLLPNVTIPNSITTIDSYSFQNCSALTEVNIGSGITTINSNAFKNCIVLVNIYISATTAPTIANANAFQGVPSTGTVHYPQGSDYSSWQSNTYLSGWTFIADL